MCTTAFGLVAYADTGNVLSSQTAPGTAGKLVYMAALVSFFSVCAVSRGHFRRGYPAAWVLLAFTLVAAVAYASQLVQGRPPNSYLTAFMPTMLYSMVLVLPDPQKPMDGIGLVGFLTAWLAVLGAVYAFELCVRSARGELGDINNLENHVKSIALVVAAGLAIVSSRWRWLMAIAALSALTTLLRPSSTFILALAACSCVALLMRTGRTRMAVHVSYVILFVLALSPFLVTYLPAASDLVLEVESALKREVLGGQSNTEVRLTIQTAAMSDIQGVQWAFGQLFTGSTSVFVADLLPWWWDNSESGLATIHSDYVIIFVQSGLVGYIGYNLVLVALCRQGLGTRSNTSEGDRLLQATFPICIVALSVYSAANPFLQYFQISHVVWVCVGLAQYALLKAARPAAAHPLMTAGRSTGAI